MRSLDIYSEPYAPTGNIGDSGLGKLLGTPEAGQLETLVREAIQNSCDATLPSNNPVIHFSLRTLAPSQACLMKDELLSARPCCDTSAQTLDEVLSDTNQLKVLEISDFGTSGLVGPVRADCINPNERTDFIDFFRNVGTARNTHQGGGTYGFGKVALYLASQCRTILVDTMVSSANGTERRLMLAHLGAAHGVLQEDGTEKRHTGRHWWGKAAADTIVDPICGKDAEEFAFSLGLPNRGPDDFGTTIMVLAPLTGEEGLAGAGREIVSTILHTFWPRMTEDCPVHQKLQVSVSVEGEALEVPRPEFCAPYDLFARAMAELRGDDKRVRQIRCGRPKALLGHLAAIHGLKGSRNPTIDLEAFGSGTSHHIALMRPVGFVVKYLPCETIADENLEWAGVFVTSDEPEIECAFAESEPPAHDNWQPALLAKGSRAKTFVNMALKRISEEVPLLVPAIAQPAPKSEDKQPSVTHIATMFGGHLRAKKQGIRRKSKGARKKGQKSSETAVSNVSFTGLVPGEDGVRALAKYRIDIKRARRGDQIQLEPLVAIGGGQPAVKQAAGRLATVESVADDKGRELILEANRFSARKGVVNVLVAIPQDARVDLDVVVIESSEEMK